VTTMHLIASLAVGGSALVLLARDERPAFRAATPVVFGALVLWLWQVVCTGYGVPEVLLPPPSHIGAAIIGHMPTLGRTFSKRFCARSFRAG
jgi:NitT/TauT family transport system permease protein